MMILHNTKVVKIQNKYRQEVKMKQEAKQLGISYQELMNKKNEVDVLVPKKGKPFGGKKSNFDVVIKMKN